ncbi:MlaD family protein [Nevskia soli]|uniref:MlaD family protein n=1 Tax=Nevskia soli TaxID=418856 RepID=UPI0004A6C5F0|nr:MlaD family protein [Nevskia soli]
MKKANPALIGGFVVGALLLGAVAVLAIGGGQLFQRKQYAVIYFSGSVTGLAIGAPVNFRGVRVGQVTDIRLQFDASNLSARIPVYITINPRKIRMLGGKKLSVVDVPFEKFIEKGMRAQLAIQSLVTGQLDVELDFQPDTPAVFIGDDPDSNEIPAMRSDFDTFRDQLSQLPLRQITDELRETMQVVRQLAVTANSELASTAGSARQTTDALTKAVGQLQSDTARTLASVQKLSDHVDTAVTTLSPQLNQTLLTAQSALKDADATLAHTSELTAPGAPMRADLEQALRNLAIASEALRNFSETIDRNPQSLITGVQR